MNVNKVIAIEESIEKDKTMGHYLAWCVCTACPSKNTCINECSFFILYTNLISPVKRKELFFNFIKIVQLSNANEFSELKNKRSVIKLQNYLKKPKRTHV